MGWSFSTYDIGRDNHIERITSQKHFSPGYTPLEHRVVGNHVWQLVRIESENRTFITLDLIAKEKGGGWGYKGLSEDMGPSYYDCPLSLLNKADAPVGGYATAWREKVREHHASKKAKPKFAVGMTVTLWDHTYRLDANLGRKGWRVTRSDGNVYRMPSRHLSHATI